MLAKGNTSKEFHASTWIHVLDSGGQPQFADISWAFLCGNCLNIIVTKLNEVLSNNPRFLCSVTLISGQVVYQPCLPHMTNLQLIEYFVRSIVSAKHTVVKVDFKLLIGTNYDHTLGKITLFKKKELEPLHEKFLTVACFA